MFIFLSLGSCQAEPVWLTGWCWWRKPHSCGKVESCWLGWQRETKQNSGWSECQHL